MNSCVKYRNVHHRFRKYTIIIQVMQVSNEALIQVRQSKAIVIPRGNVRKSIFLHDVYSDVADFSEQGRSRL